MIKSLIFRSHQFKTNTSENLINSINPTSITQRFEPQKDVNIPDILVPDPLLINPNSINNVQKVLDYIKEISRINKDERKWIAMTCDGISYCYAQKFKNDYSEIFLIPDPLLRK